MTVLNKDKEKIFLILTGDENETVGAIIAPDIHQKLNE